MLLGVRWGIRATRAPLLLVLFLSAASIAGADPPRRAAYVVGANDGSVARVDLDTGSVVSNLMTVGAGANRVAVDDTGDRAVVVGSSSDSATLIDLATESVQATWPLPAGSNPWAAAWYGDLVLVTGLLSDHVYGLDVATGAIVDSVAVGKAPEGLVLADGKLYVANTGFDFSTFGYDPGSVSVIDPATLTPLATVSVATNPQECVRAPDGTVHVVCTGDFGLVSGEIDVLDPASDTPVALLPVPGYPGSACVAGSRILLGVTTPAFSSEIRGYDATTLEWVWDETNPLLPSLDFYGNVRATSFDELLVCDFSADLLIVQPTVGAGGPQAYLVGDGPIDAAVVEHDAPTALAVSGLYALATDEGVRLGWSADVTFGLLRFLVERSDTGEPWQVVADGIPVASENGWTDRDAPANHTLRYRVGAVAADGTTLRFGPIAIRSRAGADARLAFRGVRPNPSRGTTRFDLTVPRDGLLDLELYDVSGRRVRALRRPVPAGDATVSWDGRDVRGRPVPPGAYFARVTLDNERTVARVTRLR